MQIGKILRRSTRLNRRHTGFTLTELAVVMVIVALLVGGMLVPLSAQKARSGSAKFYLIGRMNCFAIQPCSPPQST